MADQIRYDLLTQQALRGVVRAVLADAAKKGLPGDHHFFIEFDTLAPGVRMSDRLRAQHPEKMTIILQHQFWDLAVNDQGFEVRLSFGGVMERLAVPFDAIHGFFDPSVQFGLQFEEVTEGQGQQKPSHAQENSAKTKRVPAATDLAPAPPPAALSAVPNAKPGLKSDLKPEANPDPKPDKPSGGGEVVRLDRFRKK
jgi:hypothetical protein